MVFGGIERTPPLNVPKNGDSSSKNIAEVTSSNPSSNYVLDTYLASDHLPSRHIGVNPKLGSHMTLNEVIKVSNF